MSIISKAALAAELRISKSRVSQYVASGMPVRGDGKVDREAALAWITRNQRSGRDHSKGAAQAQKLKPIAPGTARLDPYTLMFVLRRIFKYDRFYAAHAAVDVGVSLKQSFALSEEMHSALLDQANELLGMVGLGRFEMTSEEEADSRPMWDMLADRAGEPIELEAWKAYLNEVRATAAG